MTALLEKDIAAHLAMGTPVGHFDTPTIRRREVMDQLAERDKGWHCFYCNGPLSNDLPKGHPHKAVVEHVVPKHLGGTDSLRNLVLSCHRCNSRKARRSIEGFLDPRQPIFPCWQSWVPIIERWEAALA